MTQNSKKILWAVDAFTEDKQLHDRAASLIRAWVKGQDISVEPVFVMSPDQLNVPMDVFGGIKLDAETVARKNLKDLVRNVRIPSLLEPTVLTSNNMSLRNAIQTLLSYAKQSKAGLIVVSTQSKKGVSRFFFGSFAESLVLQADVPVVMVSPKTTKLSKVQHILYATDLTEKAHEALEEVMALSGERKLKLTLFNKVEYLTEYTVATLHNNPTYQKTLQADLVRRKKMLEELATEVRAKGIKVDVVMDSKPTDVSISNAVLKAATRYKADLIAMASQTGPVVSAILGSVTRQVIRGAKCPVWVIHPKEISTVTKNSRNQASQKKEVAAV